MDLIIPQRPSAPAAAWATVAHKSYDISTDANLAFAAWRRHGCSGLTDGTTAGKDIPVMIMNAQLMGDVRGVPPRGRPV